MTARRGVQRAVRACSHPSTTHPHPIVAMGTPNGHHVAVEDPTDRGAMLAIAPTRRNMYPATV